MRVIISLEDKMEVLDYVKKNYLDLVEEIAELGREAGRSVRLVAVTKSGSDEEILALAAASVTDIGENRPGELRRRGQLLNSHGYSPRLHEIGNLQRNKVKLIIGSVALIHSLDSISLAKEIDRQAGAIGRKIPVLIEINSGREAQKGGILPEEAEEFYLKIKELPNIEIAGLMTMGPVCEDAEMLRPCFRETKALFDRLNRCHGFSGEGILSMGMSDSYSVAIQEGSTLVRVGRKLFNR